MDYGFFLLLRWDAAAEEDEVKSQIEKLWQEVNSLKEMQALQTGTAFTTHKHHRTTGLYVIQ